MFSIWRRLVVLRAACDCRHVGLAPYVLLTYQLLALVVASSLPLVCLSRSRMSLSLSYASLSLALALDNLVHAVLELPRTARTRTSFNRLSCKRSNCHPAHGYCWSRSSSKLPKPQSPLSGGLGGGLICANRIQDEECSNFSMGCSPWYPATECI